MTEIEAKRTIRARWQEQYKGWGPTKIDEEFSQNQSAIAKLYHWKVINLDEATELCDREFYRCSKLV